MEGLKALFGSKKVQMSLGTIFSVALVVWLKMDVPVEILATLIGLVATLIFAQGKADDGKVAAAILADVEYERIEAIERVEAAKLAAGKPVDPTLPSP